MTVRPLYYIICCSVNTKKNHWKIETTGPTGRKGIEVTGLWMVAEKWEDLGPSEEAATESTTDSVE